MKQQPLILLALCLGLNGCAWLNGVPGSSDKFACKAPDGVSCSSVSGTYANAQANNLPAQRAVTHGTSETPASDTPNTSANYKNDSSSLPVVLPGVPIRSDPRTLRVWVAPWVDSDGDLHDQSHMYLVVDPGKWQIEHTKVATVRQSLGNTKYLSTLKTPPTKTGESK